jgi:ketosteroid isomerase-like protein
VSLIRRVLSLFNELPRDSDERHSSDTERELIGCFDEDVTFIQPAVAAGAGLFDTQGRDAFRKTWDEWLTTWISHETEVLEIREKGDRILAVTEDRLTGRDGLELTLSGGSIYTVRGGIIVRLEVFPDAPEEARDAFESGTPADPAP